MASGQILPNWKVTKAVWMVNFANKCVTNQGVFLAYGTLNTTDLPWLSSSHKRREQRQWGILQLLAAFRLIGKDSTQMSLYEKTWHRGQKVVWAVEQETRAMQRHGSPKSLCTMNLRAEVGRSKGKCGVWFCLKQKIFLCSVGSILLP